MPAVIAVTIVFGTGFALDNVPRTPSLAFLLPIPVAALAILWLGLTSPRYGDLTVSSTEIKVVGLFGLVSVIERSGVAKIVKATIIYPARYGSDPINSNAERYFAQDSEITQARGRPAVGEAPSPA